MSTAAPGTMTIQEALMWAQVELHGGPHPGSPATGLCHGGGDLDSEMWDSTKIDARTLLQHALCKNRAWLLAHINEALEDQTLTKFKSYIKRRKQHEPIQYITGEQEFYGIPIRVTQAVLIPRPETEHLVEAALEIIATLPAGARLLDIGTGSGAIVIPIALSSPATRITAVDISPAALEVAQANLAAHNLTHRVRLLQSDLFSAIPDAQFEIILSNPPYIAESDRESLAVQVRDYEPHQALFAGVEGLNIYRKLIPASAAALTAGGFLLLEIGAGQSDAIKSLLEQSNLTNIHFVRDLQQIPRVVIAQKPLL